MPRAGKQLPPSGRSNTDSSSTDSAHPGHPSQRETLTCCARCASCLFSAKAVRVAAAGYPASMSSANIKNGTNIASAGGVCGLRCNIIPKMSYRPSRQRQAQAVKFERDHLDSRS